MHDTTLERTTNAPRDLRARAERRRRRSRLERAARLDAGGWHSRAYAGEPLPTLENMSRFCLANGYFLNIEIKPTPGRRATHRRGGRTACGPALEQRARAAAADFVPARSTAGRPVDGRRTCRAACLLDTLWTGWLDVARELECVAIVCNHALWDRATRRAGPRRGLAVPELHRQRRVGGAAPARAGHRRHHHRPRGPVRAGLTGLTSGRRPATPASPPRSSHAPGNCGGRSRA